MCRWRCICGLVGSVGRQLGQVLLTLAFLPYDAFISLDAIGRTLVRLLLTHKRLLEWQTSSDAERTTRTGPAGFYATMWIAPVVALAGGSFLALMQPSELPLAAPFLGLWLASPWIAWRISQPLEPSAVPELDPEQLAFLRRTARKTWRFFETFVTAQEHWLPPDNFQEEPVPVLASRTSPTNMGLALLANLAAWDFGYLSVGQLVRRTQDALATMQRLERHRGHFFNWYDTRTLKPLLPLYVSSVDSGNLAGHLLTLGAGLAEFQAQPILAPQVFAGLSDTVGILRELAGRSAELEQLEAELGAAALDPARRVCLAATSDRSGGGLDRRAQRGSRGGIEMVDPGSWNGTAGIIWRICFSWRLAGVGASDSSGRPGKRCLRIDSLDAKLAQLDQAPTLRQVSQLDQSLCPLIEAALQDLSPEPASSPEAGGGSTACPTVALPAGSQQPRPPADPRAGNLGSAKRRTGRDGL